MTVYSTKHKIMTIYEIKRRTEGTAPHFFSRQTMRFFGQTMRDFKVYKQKDGKFLISAPIRDNGRTIGETRRIFNPETNNLEYTPKEQFNQ